MNYSQYWITHATTVNIVGFSKTLFSLASNQRAMQNIIENVAMKWKCNKTPTVWQKASATLRVRSV